MPVNRWLIARGKGHVAVHETGIHGGPPVRVVAWVAASPSSSASAVLLAELLSCGYSYCRASSMSRREARRAGGIAAITPAKAAKTSITISEPTG